MNSDDIIRQLTQAGWVLQRTKGSHHQYTHPDRPELGTVTVPHPKKDLPKGTAHRILKQAGLK